MITKILLLTLLITNNSAYTVKATRIGCVGQKTASGHVIEEGDVFVALPSRKALHKKIKVTYKGKIITTKVIDVGPWSIRDDYWNHGRRPLAEDGKRLPKRWGKARNPAGIDLSNGCWDKLGIKRGKGIVTITWEFITNES